jgi:hypothetical protein
VNDGLHVEVVEAFNACAHGIELHLHHPALLRVLRVQKPEVSVLVLESPKLGLWCEGAWVELEADTREDNTGLVNDPKGRDLFMKA